MSEIRIRVATAEDIDAMTDLDATCFSAPWSRASFEAELTTNHLAWYLVAEELLPQQEESEAEIIPEAEAEARDLELNENRVGLIIGYAGLWAIEDEGHITNVAVHPDFRRMHLGHILVDMLIGQTRQEGLKRFTLEVRVSNAAAIALYEQFGFVSAGLRKGYYEDNNEDAMIMWLEADENDEADTCSCEECGGEG
jgi:[ribosomal protein S18]-alanine N-acetyltransferase